MAMTDLPSLRYRDGIKKASTIAFGGYDHNIGAGDGSIWDEGNMTSDWYPVMGNRQPRYTTHTTTKPNALYALDGLWWVDGTKLYHDAVEVTTVIDGEKQMAAMGKRLLIWPDKIVVNASTNTSESLGSSVTATCTIKDGTYAGEEAEKNTIYCSGMTWATHFQVGDAVTITGATNTSNNKTAIIREIDGDEMHFYENSFINEGPVSLTLARTIPDLDFICVNENRCWGCKGDTIYASKLGDPKNWNVYDGVSTDSYAVDAGSDGDFTACCSYLGYPVFFKEEHIYKVYGSRPANFQLMGSATMGVKEGAHKTIAVAGETLYYLSRAGIVAYAGGVPENISKAFGVDRFSGGAGGSDGIKYHVTMQGPDGWEHFVWDTRRAMWHREDTVQAKEFAFSDGELWMLAADGKLWGLGLKAAPSGAVSEIRMKSFVETGDFTEGDPNRKGTAKLQLRGEIAAGATLIISIRFDSAQFGAPSAPDGLWETVAVLKGTKKRSWYLPIIPRRSDHFRLKFDGIGDWRLYSLVRENYSGSEI